jgi:hypothetical protein
MEPKHQFQMEFLARRERGEGKEEERGGGEEKKEKKKKR